MRIKRRRIFLIDLEITDNSCIGYGYKKGMVVNTVVETISKHHAMRKVESAYNGGLFPSFIIKEIRGADEHFYPLLQPMDEKTKNELMFYRNSFWACLNDTVWQWAQSTKHDVYQYYNRHKPSGRALQKEIFKKIQNDLQ